MFGLTPDAIKVTDTAIEYLKKCMNMDDESVGIRLRIIDGKGCGGSEYDMDFVSVVPENDDLLELSDGIKIYIPKQDVLKLFGTTIDYITDKLGNKRIQIINPNEASQCGCGMSVNFEE